MLSYTSQTTLSVDDTVAIVEALYARFPDIVPPHKSDICYATTNRQSRRARGGAEGRRHAGGRRAQLVQLRSDCAKSPPARSCARAFLIQ